MRERVGQAHAAAYFNHCQWQAVWLVNNIWEGFNKIRSNQMKSKRSHGIWAT